MKHALLLLSLIATQAHAQIIYTDVIPDATYNTFFAPDDTCSLDMDNDGNIDFLIVQRTEILPCPGSGPAECATTNTAWQSGVKITPMGTNAVATTGSYASQLPHGDAIDAALTWNNTSGQVLTIQGVPVCGQYGQQGGFAFYCASGIGTGPWGSGSSYATPKFLGLRFESAGSTYHGWARLSIFPNNATLTLLDYSYNSTPGQAILAGDNGTGFVGITSTALRGMQVAPNPFTSVLNISLPTGTAGAVSCRVLSLLGQAVITRTAAATSGPSSITLDLESLAPGTYLLEMQTGGECIVRKVVKE